jgi:hypothetical protein
MKQINIIHLHMPQTNIHYSFEMPQTLNYSFAHATDFDTEIHLYPKMPRSISTHFIVEAEDSLHTLHSSIRLINLYPFHSSI